MGGGEAEVAGEEGVVDEAELFGDFLDGVEAGEEEALGVEDDVFADDVHRLALGGLFHHPGEVLFREALATGIEGHRAVLAGEVVEVFLEAEQNFLLAGCRHREAVGSLPCAGTARLPLESGAAVPLTGPFKEKAGKDVGKSGEDAISGLAVTVGYNVLDRMAELLEVLAFLLGDSCDDGFVAVEEHLTEILAVRPADSGHDVFGVEGGKNQTAALGERHLFQNLASKDDEHAVVADAVVPLLHAERRRTALAVEAETQRNLYRESKFPHGLEVSKVRRPLFPNVVDKAEFPGDLDFGDRAFEVVYSEGGYYFIIFGHSAKI